MKKLFTTILVLTTFYSMQAQKTGIELDIKGWTNNIVYLLRYTWGEEDEILDTLQATNGKMAYFRNTNNTTEVIFFAAKNNLPVRTETCINYRI